MQQKARSGTRDSWSEELLYDLNHEPVRLRKPGFYRQRFIAVDYGTTNPMVFLDIYDDGNICWVARAYYWDSLAEMREKTDAEYVEDLIEFIGPGLDAMRHANISITMNTYTHAVSGKKRQAQSKVVEMILPRDRTTMAVSAGGIA